MQPDTPHWTTALPDWERRILARESLVPVRPLYPEMAQRAQDIFANLILRDVIGKPRIGDVTQMWVYEFVAAIFGAQCPETYRRHIRNFFLLISKKNTKSTISAGIMITALELEQQLGIRESSEYLIIAPTKKVADAAFEPAYNMIVEDPFLNMGYNTQVHTRTITNLATNSKLRVVAADDHVVGGSKATGVLIDELHLFGNVRNAEAIIAEATGGLLSRVDGFVIKLSTQSTEPPAGVFRAELDYARDVRDGKIIDPTYMPVLYEFPRSMIESGAYLLPENFYVTNPNLGVSVDVPTLMQKYHTAKASTEPAALQEFLAKHLNVEIGLNLRSNAWAGADVWQKNALPELNSLDWLIEHCDQIAVGLDGGGLDDLLGFCAVGKLSGQPEKWVLWGMAWANEIVLERRKNLATQLNDFAQQGDLIITQKVGDENEQAAQLIARIEETGKLVGVGIDKQRPTMLLDALNRAGFPDGYATGVNQGWKLCDDIAIAEQKLGNGTLQHGNQPLMNWSVGNAKATPQGNAVSITKQHAGAGKIDSLIALFCAINVLKAAPEPENLDDWLDNIVIA